MLINEVIRQVDLTRRAVKFYEEKGLIKPSKDSNGYRNYTEEDIQRLKEISVYRKLGISIPDIKRILEGKEEKLLENIYESKKASLQTETKELDALKAFIEGHDIEAAYQEVDYQTIGQAMLDMVPGYYGYYFMQHFQPYLQIRISTPEQQEAYRTILDFWDQTRLHPPLFMTLMTWPMYRLTPRPALDQMIRKMDDQIRMYLNPTAEEYAALKKKNTAECPSENRPHEISSGVHRAETVYEAPEGLRILRHLYTRHGGTVSKIQRISRSSYEPE